MGLGSPELEELAIERASVNGIELGYETAGDGEPVLPLHGAFIAGSF